MAVAEEQVAPKQKQIYAAFFGQEREYAFSPKPDITPAELADVLTFVYMAIGVNIGQVPPVALDALFVDSFSPEVRRHFRVKEKPQIVVPN